MSKTIIGLVAILALATTHAHAQSFIGFESVPGGAPSDGLPISNQFLASHGVTFMLANGNAPVLAEVGPPETAFQGYNVLPDEPAPGTGVGQFFLTDDGTITGIPSDLIISYSNPVSAAGGLILDIDGSEEWTVEASNAGGAVVATVVLGPNGTLDGSASMWSFNPGIPVIAEIRITFTGVAPSNAVGLAFDRFYTDSEAPGTGQPNSPLARLRVNGVGTGTGNGPFDVFLGAGGVMALEWGGPPNGALLLAGGPSNPGHVQIPCYGRLDIGTPPWSDIFVLFDGTTPPLNTLFTLDSTGNAVQSFSLPNLPPGPLFAIQGFVYQPTSSPCFLVMTASFRLGIN